ncbi:SdpI family protein [Saccharomonospora sp. NPDC046836]|uniref:SdpI family protein n=1 Tax=Saccharomonospora sp. NPDC046836 TaxID=3156921 RepID=UPI00340CB4DA
MPTDAPDIVAAIVIAVLLLGCSLILDVLARALAQGRFGRNVAVGIRIASTLRSPEAWSRGHAAARRPAHLTAVTTAVIALVSPFATGLPALYAVTICAWVAVFLIGVVASTLAAHRAAVQVHRGS